MSRILIALVMLMMASPALGNPFGLGTYNDTTYCLVQLGDNGGGGENGQQLEITSNSSVFGSTLKGVDTKPELNKITTSKVTGSWDRETGVTNDFSSSYTGSKANLTTSAFDAIANKAVNASSYWAGETGTNIDVYLNSDETQTIAASGGGANVYTIDATGNTGFYINSGSKLTLTGGVGDYFVFNILADPAFKIQSNAIIELAGDIEASEVLFNVLGNIPDNGPDDALIGGNSIFQGILLAPGRKVEITQNHFYTFDSEGFMGTQAPETTLITAEQAITEKELISGQSSDWGGLWGQVFSGGTLNFTESDIACCASESEADPVPEPATFLLLGSGLAGLAFYRRKKK